MYKTSYIHRLDVYSKKLLRGCAIIENVRHGGLQVGVAMGLEYEA